MKMWRPEKKVMGPFLAHENDVGSLNRIFTEAFTDRYRRDGLVGVRVPALNPAIWRYALRDAGAGAMVWRDENNELVGFNMAHHSGTEGWMGPLAVRPDRQGLGIGTAMVRAAIEWLEGEGATTVGLETMPRTVENIGFYSRIGFAPEYLTITMIGDIVGRHPRDRDLRLGAASDREREQWIDRLRARLQESAPGYDFTREFQLTQELQVGDTVVVEDRGAVRGFALWHAAPLAEARMGDELRVLKLFADSPDAFERLLRAVEGCAARLRIRRVAIRCQSRFRDAYRALVARGYQVRWTDLRMTLGGKPEATTGADEVLFSNWEI